jgi:hypothetical protein
MGWQGLTMKNREDTEKKNLATSLLKEDTVIFQSKLHRRINS